MFTEATPHGQYGRRVAEQARRLGISPATLIRHLRRGSLLLDGSRLRCPATKLPGGYRVRDDDADRYYAALTADRLGPSAPIVRERADHRHEVADAALQAAGW